MNKPKKNNLKKSYYKSIFIKVDFMQKKDPCISQQKPKGNYNNCGKPEHILR